MAEGKPRRHNSLLTSQRTQNGATTVRTRNWFRLALAGIAVIAATLAAASPLTGLVLVMGIPTSTVDMNAAMKIIFSDTLVNNAVTDSELLSEFEEGGGIQTDQTTGGRFIETAQLFGLPAGVGFRAEGGYIPIPRGPILQNSRIMLKKVMAAIEMNAETLKRVRSDAGAYINWGEKAFPTLLERLKNKMDSTALGYGAGIVSRVNAAVPALNLVIDSPFGVTGLGGVQDALLQHLTGETLRASANANAVPLKAGEMVVQNVDFANGFIQVDALAAGLADNDYLFGGDTAGTDAGAAFMGLLGHVDDGSILATYQNIVRANFVPWRSNVIDAQAAPFAPGQTLTEDVVTYADDLGFTRSGAVIDLFVCSRKGVRQLWRDLKGDRAVNDPRNYTGGKGKIFMLLGDRMVPVKVARKMPETLAFGITKSTFKKFFLHEFEWDDTTGSIWRQSTDATGRLDAFWAYGSAYMELGGSDPQKNWRIENINTATI
jgi:hypothetical protein